MSLSFVETMRGTLEDPSGRKHAVDFQIRSERVSGGRFAIKGIVHADAWVDEAPCEGTLTISALPASIAYDVRFTGRDGTAYLLAGAKSPSALAPLRSMTVLPITLRTGDGRELARGTMTFDLFELPEFLASWLPMPTRPRRLFEARHKAVARRELVGG